MVELSTSTEPTGPAGPASERVELHRLAARGTYDLGEVLAILDAGHVAHVGVTTEHGPMVLPMAYGRSDHELYLHGSVANALLRSGRDTDVCVTVTLVDGLVMARSAFHNSMNYRCAVVRGTARRVEDPDEKLLALQLITDHVVENWASRRAATDAEVRTTLVLAVPLTEISGKVRSGGPVDDEADQAGAQWAGVVPLRATWQQPQPSADLRLGIEPPAAVIHLVNDQQP